MGEQQRQGHGPGVAAVNRTELMNLAVGRVEEWVGTFESSWLILSLDIFWSIMYTDIHSKCLSDDLRMSVRENICGNR